MTCGVDDRLYVIRQARGGGTKTAWFVSVRAYQYDGAGLAAAISTALKLAPGSSAYSAAFDATLGTMVLSADNGELLQFPTERELRSASWRSVNWDPYASAQYAYDTTNPASLNRTPYPVLLYTSDPADE